MSRRDELIERYADDLRTKCRVEPDMDVLAALTADCEPAIYDADAARVSSGDRAELLRVKESFLMGKLGLPDNDSLMGGIQEAIRHYGRPDPHKYRVVIYYMLLRHFDKEALYR